MTEELSNDRKTIRHFIGSRRTLPVGSLAYLRWYNYENKMPLVIKIFELLLLIIAKWILQSAFYEIDLFPAKICQRYNFYLCDFSGIYHTKRKVLLFVNSFFKLFQLLRKFPFLKILISSYEKQQRIFFSNITYEEEKNNSRSVWSLQNFYDDFWNMDCCYKTICIPRT